MHIIQALCLGFQSLRGKLADVIYGIDCPLGLSLFKCIFFRKSEFQEVIQIAFSLRLVLAGKSTQILQK